MEALASVTPTSDKNTVDRNADDADDGALLLDWLLVVVVDAFRFAPPARRTAAAAAAAGTAFDTFEAALLILGLDATAIAPSLPPPPLAVAVAIAAVR